MTKTKKQLIDRKLEAEIACKVFDIFEEYDLSVLDQVFMLEEMVKSGKAFEREIEKNAMVKTKLERIQRELAEKDL